MSRFTSFCVAWTQTAGEQRTKSDASSREQGYTWSDKLISKATRDAPWPKTYSKPLNRGENGRLIPHSTKLKTRVLHSASALGTGVLVGLTPFTLVQDTVFCGYTEHAEWHQTFNPQLWRRSDYMADSEQNRIQSDDIFPMCEDRRFRKFGSAEPWTVWQLALGLSSRAAEVGSR